MLGGFFGKAGIVLAVLGAAAVLAWPAGAGAPAQPRVLIIGDSVATAMYWHDDAVSVMQKNLAVTWEVQVCRRLAGTSCESDGVTPPTLLDVVEPQAELPPIVVLVMGYNDYEDTFAANVDATMDALLARGVRHVLWLTLTESRDPYPELNKILEAKAAQWPQLELVDWNAYSYNEPHWFQNDFVHLDYKGGIAMAHLVHRSVVALVDPLRIPERSLPALQTHHRFATRLRAVGGTPPYHWRIAAGRPPHGVHLLANGRLYGDPARAARGFSVVVIDSDGATAVERLDW